VPKEIKGNTARKPPEPSAEHSGIDAWFGLLVPHLVPTGPDRVDRAGRSHAGVDVTEAVIVRSAGADLAGEVWIAAGQVRAAVVMIGGSGPTERSNGGYFEAYRTEFAEHEVAGLWYDKRGVGGSTGDYLAGDFDHLATDALAALAHLSNRVGSDVPVGLFGHSEGGWVALRAAARSGEVAFVVTNSCPGMTPGRQDRHAVADGMRHDGVPTDAQTDALDLYDRLIAAADAGAGYPDTATLIAEAAGAEVLERYVGAFDAGTWAYWARTRQHDPMPDHAAMTCPHLASYGAADPMVPVADSAAAFTASGTDPARPSAATVTVHIVPGADHRILRPGRAAPDPGHLAAVRSWITTASALSAGTSP
jgi:uncharacterized protein